MMLPDGPGQSARLLSEVAQLLERDGIRHAVIGAMAVAVHGVVRASVDADAVVEADVRRLDEFARMLTTFGLHTELRRGDPDDPIPALLLVKDHHGNRVDLLAGLRGLDPGIYERALHMPIGGLTSSLHVASCEDLLAMKLFAGGPTDLVDARRVFAVSGSILDRELLRRLVTRYGRETVVRFEQLLTEMSGK
jgi:hypothetical protein